MNLTTFATASGAFGIAMFLSHGGPSAVGRLVRAFFRAFADIVKGEPTLTLGVLGSAVAAGQSFIAGTPDWKAALPIVAMAILRNFVSPAFATAVAEVETTPLPTVAPVVVVAPVVTPVAPAVADVVEASAPAFETPSVVVEPAADPRFAGGSAGGTS